METIDFSKPGVVRANVLPVDHTSSSIFEPAKKKTGFAGAFDSVATGSKPQQSRTMLETLAPKLDTKVTATNLDDKQVQTATQSTEVSKHAQVDVKEKPTASIGLQVKNAKEGITQAIEQAQNEVRETARELSIDPDALFADNRMAAGNELGLMAAAATGGAAAHGAGSIITIGGAMNFAVDDMKKGYKNPADLMDAIMVRLREKQAQAEQNGMTMSTKAIFTGEGMKPQPKQKLDWEAFANSNHSLKDLMSLDPKNPSPDLVPEWNELTKQENGVKLAQASHKRVESGAVAPDMADVLQSLKQGKIDQAIQQSPHKPTVGIVKVDASDFVNELLRGPKADKTSLEGADSHTRMFAAMFNNEPDLAKMGLNPTQAFSRN